jgi:NADH-quinone oxidoreductase subunit L
MYQAIVFLPLLGAIIAGAIAVVSARGRHPGGEAANGGHGHGRMSRGQAAKHEGGAGREPAAEGSRPAEVITSGFLVVAAILSWVAFFTVGLSDAPAQRIQVLNWFSSGTLAVDWAMRVDTLTVVMLVVVTTISALVHIYSIGYMAHDPHRPRFFAYLSLFTFAMLLLVTANNLVQLFLGWEGVGLASYLLIGFWYKRPAANAAAIKAFIVNRVGDFGFALGIFGLFFLFGSVNLGDIFGGAEAMVGHTINFLGLQLDALNLVTLLLFIGAMGKSAQFLLHTWLPDAMEGPTPVSALIHAATMVTAGVFLVARMSPLFEYAHDTMIFVTFIGATTAFFAATVGLVQNDIKRVIAYSTCSQLGYMFVALGIGAYPVAIFHLFTHAFFKALLFLGAGSVIHAMGDEQDMRKMGGLWRKIPWTYAMMLVGTLALTGFPFTAGYYSKDAIIEVAAAGEGGIVGYGLWMTIIAAIFTAFYSWRLIFMTFHGKSRAPESVLAHAHESPPVMMVPLYILAAGSLFAGVAFAGSFIGDGHEAFWQNAIFFSAENNILHEMHDIASWVPWAPTIAMVVGFLFAYWFYIRSPEVPRRLAEEQEPLYKFLLNKWYFDEIYDAIFVRPARWLGRFLWKRGDGWLIDGFGPDGISARVLDVTRNIVRLQSGYIYHYAFAILIGAAVLITWMLFGS